MIATGRAMLDPTEILKTAGLTLDMSYADFGSGGLGAFPFAGASLVGRLGHVYAVDILKQALANVESRAKMEGVHHLSTVWGDVERVGGVAVQEHSLHLVSLVNTVPLIRRSPDVLEEVKRLLVPDGRLLLVGWKKDATSLGASESHRIDPEEIRPFVERAGFVFQKSFEAGPNHWGLLFQRVPVITSRV